MKRILLFSLCLLIARIATAQKPSLALNEHNVYIYYEVVNLPGISADSLKKNAAGFVASAYEKNKTRRVNDTAITVKDKFNTHTALTKRADGDMAYTLTIECRDSKYRYWMTNFVFTPYERDRYGSFVPSPGIAIPLETAKSKLEKRDVDTYLAQANSYCVQLADKLKQYIATGLSPVKAEQKPAKVVTDKW